ncbi:hypothetical protein AB835_00735 [Candidatus Endobugula sertula]|uniref:Transporter n=1 Tax=Candidatus Endobugula sertula TaxID=62101 RepID=A0A1D2QU38_9GAMM|nr:hypothetical protein AB835_00735 [Candidatus Endobugula sertula]
MYKTICLSLPLVVVASFACATTIEESLLYALSHNKDLALEQARFEKEKAKKGKIYVEFLPEIKFSMQRGRQQNDALDLDRGDLDEINDRHINQLDFTQPIFNGFKGYNKAKEINSTIQSAEQYYENKKNDILIKGIIAYLNLYKAREILSLKKNNVEHGKELLALIKQRNEVGVEDGGKVTVYQTTLARYLSEELAAVEEDYSQVFDRLDDSLEIATEEPNGLNDLEVVKQTVLSNSPLLKQYAFKIDAAKAVLNQAKGEFSPKVDLVAQIQDQDNVTYLDDSDLRTRSVYINITVPLFQKISEYARLRESRRELEFAKKEYEANKKTLIKKILKVYKAYFFYQDFINHSQHLISLNQDRIAQLQQQIAAGDGDVVDWLSAKVELNNSRGKDIENYTSYLLNYYKLLVLSGTLRL